MPNISKQNRNKKIIINLALFLKKFKQKSAHLINHTPYCYVMFLFISASFCSRALDIKGKKVVFQIWDTAGQERFRSLVPMYLRDAEVALVAYDISNHVSIGHLSTNNNKRQVLASNIIDVHIESNIVLLLIKGFYVACRNLDVLNDNFV